MQSRLIVVLIGLIGFAGTSVASADPDHPFTLVNVIDLFDFFSPPEGVPLDPNDPNFPSGWNPSSGPPPNYALYVADPRLGTNPASIAVHGYRLWITGFHNGNSYEGSTLAKQLAWYNSLGVGEVQNILTTSGFDGSLIKYLDTVHLGPGIYNTDSFTGADFDPSTQILYVAFDDVKDLNPAALPPGSAPQQGAFIAAVDVDPNSLTYGEFLWQLTDPILPGPPPFPTDRFYGGVAVDPLDPTYLVVPQNGFPGGEQYGFRLINTLDPDGFDPDDPATLVNVKDVDADCPATFYRAVAFDAVTGDLFVRNANAAERIPRNPLVTEGPYQPDPRFIEEPPGGLGVADTPAMEDDVQLIPVGTGGLSPGTNIVGPGPNGVIDTLPAGDDIFSLFEVINERPIGNQNTPDDEGACDEDPVHGYPNGPFAQGQGFAVVSAGNLVDLAENVVVGNNRPTFGSGQLTDVRIFTLDGDLLDQLQLPCSPIPGDGTGIAYYDLDYDESAGTLVVCSMEERLVYVFKAQTTDGPMYPRFDFTRNGATDLHDFVDFQLCYTGPELPPDAPRLSLNCMRMNSDSDCDIDFDDYIQMEAVWDALGGP